MGEDSGGYVIRDEMKGYLFHHGEDLNYMVGINMDIILMRDYPRRRSVLSALFSAINRYPKRWNHKPGVYITG